PWKWAEGRAGPFPSVADEVLDAPGAASIGMAAGGRRIPAREVEHAVASVWRRVAPGERALVTLGRAIGRALKLRLGRKPRAAPARVGFRLRVTDIDRPGGRKSDRFEHGAPGPASRVTLPE